MISKKLSVTNLVSCCVHLLDALFDLVLTLLDVFTLLEQTTSHFAEEVLDLITTTLNRREHIHRWVTAKEKQECCVQP